ncbi:MAG: hypothetical protein F6K65_42550 [Moorea sp. SIO3C2]|nr:hypothetical protein [Moorena sp. SIO3C2]
MRIYTPIALLTVLTIWFGVNLPMIAHGSKATLNYSNDVLCVVEQTGQIFYYGRKEKHKFISSPVIPTTLIAHRGSGRVSPV